MSKFPFTEFTTRQENCVIRIFDQNVDEKELVWHLDRENRIICPLYTNGTWKIQFDNKIPEDIGPIITVKKGVMHRLIKGSNPLILFIKKIKEDEDN